MSSDAGATERLANDSREDAAKSNQEGRLKGEDAVRSNGRRLRMNGGEGREKVGEEDLATGSDEVTVSRGCEPGADSLS
jgi:hypothetical protein